jgi:hypothetical protein
MTRTSRNAARVGGAALVIILVALGPLSSSAAAHDVIQIGPYTVKWGWLLEPACIDQENAVWMLITKVVNGSSVAVMGVTGLEISLISPGGATREDKLHAGDENGTYVGEPVIPTSTGYYLLKLGGDILGEPADKTVKMDFVLGNGCRDFPPSQPPNSVDPEARRLASEAMAKANASAAAVQQLTLLVYAALGVGGASLALAGYNAHLGRQSLAIARQKESRAKGEGAADELLKAEGDTPPDAPKPVEIDGEPKT